MVRYVTSWVIARLEDSIFKLVADHKCVEDINRHPKSQGFLETPFYSLHKLYSLVVVLVEIRLRKLVEKTVGDDLSRGTSDNSRAAEPIFSLFYFFQWWKNTDRP